MAPLRVATRNINAFVKSQEQWVLLAVDKVALSTKEIKKMTPDQYFDGCQLLFQGKLLTIRFKPSVAKAIKVSLSGPCINVYIDKHDMASTHVSEYIKCALSEWLKKQALKEVERFVGLHAPKYSLYPRSIRIKTQKSRWGSCGVHNDINLNWLLILAPLGVMEYVVVHELCHIKERNHSSDFWQLVEAHLPDYQVYRKWLKQQGSSLMMGL